MASADQKLPDKPNRLEWTHKKFSTYEYIASGTMLAGLGAATLLMKDEGPRWRGGVLMDDASRDFGLARTREGQVQAARVSDYLLYSMIAWPYLDAAVAMGGGHTQTAWQMSLINSQAFIATSLLTFVIKRSVRRERPYKTAYCAENPTDPSCESGDSSSFLSGHASTAFTGAGLVCAHHGAMPLYGNKYADIGACATALAAATVTGGLRIVADKHYASDVLAGAALGLASGWLVPKLLHYMPWGNAKEDDMAAKKKSGILSWNVSPSYVKGGAMLNFSAVTW